MPVDCLFPTLYESPHRTKMEVSVATMQKRLKEPLKWQGASLMRRLPNNAAIMIVELEPLLYSLGRCYGSYRWLCGQAKVKDRWEDGGFIVESQLGDWPVTRFGVHLLMTDRNPNTGFSIGTTFCLSPMRTSMMPLPRTG